MPQFYRGDGGNRIYKRLVTYWKQCKVLGLNPRRSSLKIQRHKYLASHANIYCS